MCGIVGAISRRDVVPILIEGLKRLEYRGYDSAGVAVLHGKAAGAFHAGLRAGARAPPPGGGGKISPRPTLRHSSRSLSAWSTSRTATAPNSRWRECASATRAARR